MTGGAGHAGTAEPGAWFWGVISLLGVYPLPNGGLKKIPGCSTTYITVLNLLH
jgi:hypothetical protein